MTPQKRKGRLKLTKLKLKPMWQQTVATAAEEKEKVTCPERG
jgi:hypothetical protein